MNKMTSLSEFLKTVFNKHVGGGECAHLATEMLRATGNDFTRTEKKGTTNYVWSTNKIAEFGTGLHGKTNGYIVGDIIQFQDAVFGDGQPIHHTQVVGKVDHSGRILKVYEQNLSPGHSPVQKNPVKDFTKLKRGWVTIYRPVKDSPAAGYFEASILNRSQTSRTAKFKYGDSTHTVHLAPQIDSKGCFKTVRFHCGNHKVKLEIGSHSMSVSSRGGYYIDPGPKLGTILYIGIKWGRAL
ncbi:MAG: hypothetical protein U0892_07820 [Pirellulales bacterium]